MSEVLAVDRYESNAELLEAAFRLHVFPRFGPLPEVLDCTYGKGTWWKGWYVDDLPPLGFTQRDRKLDPGFDFRKMDEFADDTFDVVAFDPDYVAPGGRTTSTIPKFNSAYGLKDTYETPRALQGDSINAGLSECARVVNRQGLILAKTMNYISSARLQLSVHWTITHGESIGLVVEDKLTMVGDPGPQPKDRACAKCGGVGHLGPATSAEPADYGKACPKCDGTGRITPDQQHARANASVLIVFRKPGMRKKR